MALQDADGPAGKKRPIGGMRVRGSHISIWLVWLVFRKWNTGMGASLRDVTGSRSSVTVTLREKKCLAMPLARWYSPFPVDSDEVLRALGVPSVY
jgi:hypothetical protein